MTTIAFETQPIVELTEGGAQTIDLHLLNYDRRQEGTAAVITIVTWTRDKAGNPWCDGRVSTHYLTAANDMREVSKAITMLTNLTHAVVGNAKHGFASKPQHLIKAMTDRGIRQMVRSGGAYVTVASVKNATQKFTAYDEETGDSIMEVAAADKGAACLLIGRRLIEKSTSGDDAVGLQLIAWTGQGHPIRQSIDGVDTVHPTAAYGIGK